MTAHCFLLPALVAILTVHARSVHTCVVRAQTDAGWVCGLVRKAEDNSEYASFRGVPYAKQPVGELRFKELEPLERWEGNYDARNEGPICYQTDILYGKLMRPQRGMSEACITANIHVPIEALPSQRQARELVPPRQAVSERTGNDKDKRPKGLPIFVFIHGGGFAFGSGDTDLHGPEYLIRKKVIVITFNYRLNVFGFLSLGTAKIPGNAGLRDMITLLRWVKRNAASFGGDPDNVTIGGQSAGAIAAHLLTLSNAAKDLFKRAILMSGTAISSFYSPSKPFAQFIQKQLLDILAINSTDPDVIHQELINVPVEKIQAANEILINQMGLTTFVPTIETAFSGVTTVIEDDPAALISRAGKDVPILVGYANLDCEGFRRRFEEFDLLDKIKLNPLLIVPSTLLFSTPQNLIPEIAQKIVGRYYNNTAGITIDGFVRACTQGMFEYPVIKLGQMRANAKAPTYVYKLSFDNENSLIKQTTGLKYHGAAHIEDVTYIFKANSMVEYSSYPPQTEDARMKNFMTDIFVNFIKTGKPSSVKWPPVSRNQYIFEDLLKPYQRHTVRGLTRKQQEITQFYDNLVPKVD